MPTHGTTGIWWLSDCQGERALWVNAPDMRDSTTGPGPDNGNKLHRWLRAGEITLCYGFSSLSASSHQLFRDHGLQDR